MGRIYKFSQGMKLEMVRQYLEGKSSSGELARRYGCNDKTVRFWVAQYQSQGEEAFRETTRNQRYTTDFKHVVVEEYLSGGISMEALAVKFKIPSTIHIRRWIKRYNGHEEFRSYGTDGVVEVTKGRKTTYEERIEIVEYCLKNGQDYHAAAAKYQVSYQQVYSWVAKYNAKGVVALKDNRGKGKDLEDMDEKERLAAENKLLRARIERLEIEIELKKKLDDILRELESGTGRKR